MELKQRVSSMQEAIDELRRGFVPMSEMMRAVAWQVERNFRGFSKPGYYWRGGRLRRDHSYFRQRARDRRAELKRARRPSSR